MNSKKIGAPWLPDRQRKKIKIMLVKTVMKNFLEIHLTEKKEFQGVVGI